METLKKKPFYHLISKIMSILNSYAEELEKLNNDLRHHQRHLDDFFEEWTDVNFSQNKAYFQLKSEIEEKNRLIRGHITVMKTKIFSLENRDQYSEVQAESLLEDLMEDLRDLAAVVAKNDQMKDLSRIIDEYLFYAQEGIETLDLIQNVISSSAQ